MPLIRKLEGSRCYLAPVSLDDAELWTEWENDLEVAIPLGSEAHTTTAVEKMAEFIEEIIGSQQHVYNIVDRREETIVGRAMLYEVDHVNGTAKLGVLIGQRVYWDQGYGQEASALLLDYGFNLLNLHNIMLGVYAFNTRALRCYERLGFHIIGRRRQARLIGGKRHDVIFMDLLAEEFEGGFLQDLLP